LTVQKSPAFLRGFAKTSDSLGFASKNRLFYLRDCLRHFDTSRASLGAVEGGAATPYALFVVQDVKANLGSFVA
jgi:hypothetical protein